MELPSKPVVAGIIKPAVSSASISKEVFPLCDKINAVAGLAPDYCDSSGLFSAGSWAGLDFEFGPITTAAATFMVLLEGSLSIDEVGSAPHEFGPGDAFFVPAGTACSGAGQQRVHLCYATVRIQK